MYTSDIISKPASILNESPFAKENHSKFVTTLTVAWRLGGNSLHHKRVMKSLGTHFRNYLALTNYAKGNLYLRSTCTTYLRLLE